MQTMSNIVVYLSLFSKDHFICLRRATSVLKANYEQGPLIDTLLSKCDIFEPSPQHIHTYTVGVEEQK